MKLLFGCGALAPHKEKFYFFQIYELRVMETKPDKAVSIIECDMNVSMRFFFCLFRSSVWWKCVSVPFCLYVATPRWILMHRWVTKSPNAGLSTMKNWPYAPHLKYIYRYFFFNLRHKMSGFFLFNLLRRRMQIRALTPIWTRDSEWVFLIGVDLCVHVFILMTMRVFSSGLHWFWQSLGW